MKTWKGALTRYWWVYVVDALVVILVFVTVFRTIMMPKKEERLAFFVITESASWKKGEELVNNPPAGIKKFEYRLSSKNSSYYSTLLESYGYEISDVLILPGTETNRELSSYHFAPISPRYVETLGSLGVLRYDEKAYGIKVYDANTKTNLLSDLSFPLEDMYLFFNKNSVQLGDLSQAKAGEEGRAVTMAKRLLQQ